MAVGSNVSRVRAVREQRNTGLGEKPGSMQAEDAPTVSREWTPDLRAMGNGLGRLKRSAIFERRLSMSCSACASSGKDPAVGGVPRSTNGSCAQPSKSVASSMYVAAPADVHVTALAYANRARSRLIE